MNQLSWRTCVRAGVAAVLTYLVCACRYSLMSFAALAAKALSPMLLGGGIAYVVNILMRCYERHFFAGSRWNAVQRLRRPVCLLLAFATALMALAWAAMVLLPELVRSAGLLMAALPGALGRLSAWLGSLRLKELLPLAGLDWQEAAAWVIRLVLQGVSGVMDAAASVLTAAVTLGLALVFAVYLLAGKERLGAQCRRMAAAYLGREVSGRVFRLIGTLDEAFGSFIVGQCTEALILGALCFLGMMVLGFPDPLTISVMVGFTALIPVAGAYLAAAAGALMLAAESPMTALLFVVFLTILQQLEGNLIFPRVVGSSIGLPAVWVLTAVMVGGGLLGIPGMLLGVPLTAAAYRLLRGDLHRREQAAKEMN